MDHATWRTLLTPTGQDAIRAAMDLAPREVNFLEHFQTFSRQMPPDLARAALEIAILRGEGRVKFPFAEVMYFTRQALEQASAWEVSAYRVRRYAGFERLIDLGCSVGGDTLALAGIAPTLGVDLDPLRLRMAGANAAALGYGERVALVSANLGASLPFSAISSSVGLFFDPARRSAGQRVYSVHDYQPPLSIVGEWTPDYPALGVKISPGVNLAELREYPAEIEFISLRGELKEAVLWFGPLKTAQRRASLLPGPHTLTSTNEPEIPLSEPRAYLYEPDPAILRAGLVRTLGAQINAAQLDVDIAYLTSDKLASTVFGRSWEVEAWFPFRLKSLRAYLRERGVGRVTVKKRGSPLQPEELIHALRLKGEGERVIFLTHLRGRPIVIVGRNLPEESA